MAEAWQARLTGALEAHFLQPEGGSRPGTDYAVELRQGETVHTTLVRAYLSETLTRAARADAKYQGQTVLGYVFDRLAQGWTPADGPLPALTILNPNPVAPAPNPGWLGRLFGRRG